MFKVQDLLWLITISTFPTLQSLNSSGFALTSYLAAVHRLFRSWKVYISLEVCPPCRIRPGNSNFNFFILALPQDIAVSF